jgi:glycosyltransferase involved in cell wall biosynthesis
MSGARTEVCAEQDAPADALANADVTIIITCFDYGAFLSESVESALSQQGGEPRVVVVDDGSTDARTLAELDRLPARVQVIRQANAGVAEARNRALRQLGTPLALVLDADDRLALDAVKRLRAALDLDPTAGFSYGTACFFGDWEGLLKMPAYDPYRLLFRNSIGPTTLMRRELFDAVGGYDPAFSGYEDWEFWLHALELGWRGRRVEGVTFYYRRHGSSRHSGARRRYRAAYRQLRRKHAQLYAREGRRRLRQESDLRSAGRLLYRWWWGRRPLPARVELALQALLWHPRRSRQPVGLSRRSPV